MFINLKKSALLLFSIFPFLAWSQTSDWAQIEKYQKDNEKILSSGNTPVVVFMGNSITEGWPEAHPEFFSENNFTGRGISGQTTYQYLVRFRDDVINLRPKVVVINGGTNDIAENNYAYDEDRTFGNLVSMAELADANGIRVIMTAVLPSVSFPWHKHIKNIPEKQLSLNKRIKDYALSHGFEYVDYYSPMVMEDGALNPEYSADGVHPNAKGYSVMEKAVLPAITSTLSK